LGRLDLAEADFTRAVEGIENCDRKRGSFNWWLCLAYSLRAQVRNASGRKDLALADFAASRQHFPPGLIGFRAAAQAIMREDWEAAEAAFAKELADFPREPGVYVERASGLWERRGDFTRALEDYAVALALDPDCKPAYHRRGLLHEKLGDDR